jgi:hypothetical protein
MGESELRDLATAILEAVEEVYAAMPWEGETEA